MLDFHNRLVPGVDDGAAETDETRSGLAAFRSQRVSEVTTTPHVRRECVDYLCSDYSFARQVPGGRRRSPDGEVRGLSQLYALMTGNPEWLLRNKMPEPVKPLDEEATSSWKRLLPSSTD